MVLCIILQKSLQKCTLMYTNCYNVHLIGKIITNLHLLCVLCDSLLVIFRGNHVKCTLSRMKHCNSIE